MSESVPQRSIRRGSLLSLTSAVLFGLSAPLIKLLLPSSSSVVVAGLLYLGAGLVLALPLVMARSRKPREAPLRRSDLPTLAGIVALGGVAGPVLLLYGLDRVSGVAGSLLLNLEAPFTIFVAVLLFGEHVGRRGIASLVLVLLGAVLLGARGGEVRVDPLGMLAVGAACLCWAFDNNLTQRLSGKDPIALTRVKCLVAGATNLVLGLSIGRAALPAPAVLGATILVGAFSYGVSLVVATFAMRAIGAARHAVHFSIAPFVGALASLPILGEAPRWADLGGMTLMAVGIVALLREQHRHVHAHEALEHDHLHEHDDHHRHDHPPGLDSGEPHAHVHRHDPLVHDHAHASDHHHRHDHTPPGASPTGREERPYPPEAAPPDSAKG